MHCHTWIKNSLGVLAFHLLVCVMGTPAIAWQDPSPAPIQFEDFFLDKALRLELFLTGDAKELVTTIHAIAEEPLWPECPSHCVTSLPYGRFRVQVTDSVSKQLIYSRGFDTLFAEYATTKPALEGKKKVYPSTVRIPFPKRPVNLSIERRNPDLSYSAVLSEQLDPESIAIRKESVSKPTAIKDLHTSGDPKNRVDIAFLAEGYTLDEEEKFWKDAERMTSALFETAPYSENKDRFNIRAVFCASTESGTDNPRKGIFRNTVLGSSFNALDIDRYLLVEDNHRMHQIAAAVPYDSIVVLVNSTTYGGGSICLDYCVCTTDLPSSPKVFVHELGHGLCYLADEYVGNVSYNDIFPEGIEPVEPNITRELDPNKIKWKAFLTKDVSIPTTQKAARELTKQSATERVVGAFEGGGYLSKGMYRAEYRCLMGTSDSKQGFCVACEQGILRVLDHYAPTTSNDSPTK
jgi:hypothetical protein